MGVFFPLLATREDKIKSVLFLFETYKYNSNIFAMCYKYLKKKRNFIDFNGLRRTSGSAVEPRGVTRLQVEGSLNQLCGLG